MKTTSNKFSELRQRAEAILFEHQQTVTANSFYDISSLIHELDTYQVELELQNQELLQTHKQLQESHQDYVNLYNFSAVAYITLDEHGIIRNANFTLAKLLAVPKSQLLGQPFSHYIVDTDQDIFYLQRQALLGQPQAHATELRLKKDNGEILWVQCQGFMINLSTDYHINFVLTDISLLKTMEEDLRLGACIFAESEQGIMIADADLTILKVNRAYSLITGYSEAEVLGQKTNFLKSGKHDALFYHDMWATIQQKQRWQGEIWNKRKNGEIYPEWLNITSRHDINNEITHYIGIFSDITNQKNAETRINFMAYYDALTQLPNRTLLQDRIDYAISRSRRTEQFNALMLLDLDHFKVINDSLGHEVGDHLLIEVAKRLSSSVRQEDTVARLGGDEFVILLHELHLDQQTAMHTASDIAENIGKKLQQPINCSGHDLHISVSIGITLFQGDSQLASELIKNADNAMYKAKNAGRNKSQFFSSDMKQHADSRLMIETELRGALQRGELELYYQPQTDIVSNSICGAEVLLRWQHPLKGLILPDTFIPIAEQTGLIIAIGSWVIQSACQQLAQWHQAGLAKDLQYLAVNVSPHQFQQTDFVDIVSKSITTSAIKAEQLELELTESVLIQNIGDTLDKLKALKALGVRIAIDDFGTGYSSLSYLKRFPLDVLKIDQSFIRDITTEANDAAIVQTIITLASNLHLRVMAEGVETAEQLASLRQWHCQSYQGYLCSHPLPKTAFIALLHSLES